MPKVGTYRANSVIYFQGDLGDKIFVLQRGRVTLNYNDIETGKLIREIIQTGEFFGVKSALGRYPREENAVVLRITSYNVCYTKLLRDRPGDEPHVQARPPGAEPVAPRGHRLRAVGGAPDRGGGAGAGLLQLATA